MSQNFVLSNQLLNELLQFYLYFQMKRFNINRCFLRFALINLCNVFFPTIDSSGVKLNCRNLEPRNTLIEKSSLVFRYDVCLCTSAAFLSHGKKSGKNLYIYISFHFFLCLSQYNILSKRGCKMHRLHLYGRVRHPHHHQRVSCYDTKQSDGEVPVMQELWGMRSTPSLPLIPDPFWSGMRAPDRV